MSEGSSTTTPPAATDAATAAAGQQATTTAAGQDAGRTFTQEDLNRLLAAERRASEAKFADAVAKATEYDKLSDKEKTDLQRQTERAEQLEKDLAGERTARLRLEAAQEARLPVEMAARLQGTTKEELKADAEALAKLLPAQQATNSFRDAQGRAAGPAGTTDWLRESLARR